jgi:hypothetical protein
MSDTLSTFAAALKRWMSCRKGKLGMPRDDSHFNELALRLFRLQHAANPDYRQLCASRGVRTDAIQHWQDIPPVSTSAFKQAAFSCLPPADRTTFFESSGTTATSRSRHHHSAESLALYEAALLPWFRTHLLQRTDQTPCRFLSLTPPALQAPHSSLVHMLDCVSRHVAFEWVLFAGQGDAPGNWRVEQDAAIQFLREASREHARVLMTGTAFNFVQWLEGLDANGVALQLPEGSCVMETGGYKGRSRSLSKPELHQRISRVLAVPAECIVTEYGMTELSSQAYDREAATQSTDTHLRFPPWTRAVVVSPETGRGAAPGDPGLLRVYDLANAFSVLAIETGDLAVQKPAGVSLIGRSPLIEPRGCSLRSGDLETDEHERSLALRHAP